MCAHGGSSDQSPWSWSPRCWQRRSPLPLPPRRRRHPRALPWSSASIPDATPAERAAELFDAGLTVVDELPGSDYALARPEDGVVRAAAAVQASDAIEEMAPLVTYRAFGVPNDPGYPAQWHLPAIDATSAWDITTGTRDRGPPSSTPAWPR